MSKKFFYVAALLAGLVFTGTSCADDKGDNDDDDDDKHSPASSARSTKRRGRGDVLHLKIFIVQI